MGCLDKFALTSVKISRALGTALDWPDAKKRAHQVREWGIKVSSDADYVLRGCDGTYDDDYHENLTYDVNSNSWRSGIKPRERSVMPCCGGMRSVMHKARHF